LTRMFKLDRNQRIKTWNPLIGCIYHCYGGACWARIYASRWKCPSCKEFIPHSHPERFNTSKFRSGDVVFAGAMTDIFCGKHRWKDIYRFFRLILDREDIIWFFESKNPAMWMIEGWLDLITKDAIISTTIESDLGPIVRKFTSAPKIENRIKAMKEIPWHRKHISIEPVIVFSPKFADILLSIPGLKMVSIGFLNWGKGLPEPSDKEVDLLIKTLRASGIYVEDKRCRKSRSKLISSYQQLADQFRSSMKN